MDNAVPDEVRRLIACGVASMDHVDLLFHLGAQGATLADLARTTRFNIRLLEVLASDLEKADLVTCRGGEVLLTASPRDRKAITELLAVYNSRPVTLVRALYARELFSRTLTDALTPKPSE